MRHYPPFYSVWLLQLNYHYDYNHMKPQIQGHTMYIQIALYSSCTVYPILFHSAESGSVISWQHPTLCSLLDQSDADGVSCQSHQACILINNRCRRELYTVLLDQVVSSGLSWHSFCNLYYNSLSP
jgi:hypothetical protein